MNPDTSRREEDVAGERAWAQEILVAVDSLDRRSAMALRLIYLRRATQAQAAEWLGLPESEVKSVVADGMQRLATLILPRRS